MSSTSKPIDLSDTSFDLVLIDIEGSEYFAMRGMKEILTNTKTLIVEFLPHHITNVAGIRLTDFLDNIPQHLGQLTIPSKNVTYPIGVGTSVLRQMFDNGDGDEMYNIIRGLTNVNFINIIYNFKK